MLPDDVADVWFRLCCSADAVRCSSKYSGAVVAEIRLVFRRRFFGRMQSNGVK